VKRVEKEDLDEVFRVVNGLPFVWPKFRLLPLVQHVDLELPTALIVVPPRKWYLMHSCFSLSMATERLIIYLLNADQSTGAVVDCHVSVVPS
jgi:hypothetical protein